MPAAAVIRRVQALLGITGRKERVGCLASQKLTKEQFIEQAHVVHGDKFDYSLVELDNGSLSQVKIICPEHGVFVQRRGRTQARWAEAAQNVRTVGRLRSLS